MHGHIHDLTMFLNDFAKKSVNDLNLIENV